MSGDNHCFLGENTEVQSKFRVPGRMARQRLKSY